MGDKKVVTLAAALTAECHSRYESEVLSLDSLPAEEARKGALKIVRRLAYSGFQLDYSNEEITERFDHLWRLAFPDGRVITTEKTGGIGGQTR